MAGLGELYIALGFDVDDKTLKAFDKGVKDLKDNMFNLSAGSLAALYTFDRFVHTTTDGAVALESLHDQTGVALDTFQLWAGAAHNVNRELDKMAASGSIAAFAQNLALVQKGTGGSLQGFGLLGITNPLSYIGKEGQLLDEVRKKVLENKRNFSRGFLTDTIKSIGLDPRFISLLTAPEEDFQKAFSKARTTSFTDEDIEKLEQINALWDDLVQKTEKYAINLTAANQTEISKFISDLDKLGEHLGNDIKLINEYATGFKILGAGLAAIFAPILTILASVGYLIDKVANSKEGFSGFFEDLASLNKEGMGQSLNETIYNTETAKWMRSFLPKRGEGGAKIEQNNTYHISGVNDAQAVGETVKKTVFSGEELHQLYLQHATTDQDAKH